MRMGFINPGEIFNHEGFRNTFICTVVLFCYAPSTGYRRHCSTCLNWKIWKVFLPILKAKSRFGLYARLQGSSLKFMQNHALSQLFCLGFDMLLNSLFVTKLCSTSLFVGFMRIHMFRSIVSAISGFCVQLSIHLF